MKPLITLLFILSIQLAAQNTSPKIYGLLYENNLEFFIEFDPYTGTYAVVDTLTEVEAIALASSTFDQTTSTYIFRGVSNMGDIKLYAVNADNGDILNGVVTPSSPAFPNELEYDMKQQKLFGLQYDFSNQIQNFVEVDVNTGQTTIIGTVPNAETIAINSSSFNSNLNQYMYIGNDEFNVTRLYTIDAISGMLISSPEAPYFGNTEMRYDNLNNKLYGLFRNIPTSLYDDSLFTASSIPLQLIEIDPLTANFNTIASIDSIEAIALGQNGFVQDSSHFVLSLVDINQEKRVYVVDVNTGDIIANSPFSLNAIELQCDNSEFSKRKYRSTNDTILLKEGWNLISLDITPDNNAITEVFSSLASGNLLYVTGFDNVAKMYNSTDLSFLNTLTTIENGFGYWVRVSNDDTLIVSGLSLEEDYRKDLDAGWNLVAYPKDTPATPSDYYADLIGDNNLEFVTGFNNIVMSYDPNGLSFLNTLEELKNGFGYWVKVTNAVTGKEGKNINNTNVFSFYNGRTNLKAGEKVFIETSNNEVLAVMDVIQDGYLMTTPVYGDDPTTTIKESIAIGTPLQFRYNSQVLNVGSIYKGDMGAEKIDLQFDLDIETPYLSNVYPNPVIDKINFELNQPIEGMIELKIYNINGQLMDVVKERESESGFNHIQYDISKFPNGVYTYSLSTAHFSKSGKIEVLR